MWNLEKCCCFSSRFVVVFSILGAFVSILEEFESSFIQVTEM